jgi:hypothetical protein
MDVLPSSLAKTEADESGKRAISSQVESSRTGSDQGERALFSFSSMSSRAHFDLAYRSKAE